MLFMDVIKLKRKIVKMKKYTKEQILIASEIGEISMIDAMHVVSLLDEAVVLERERKLNLGAFNGSNYCKQCKASIEKGSRFCSGECKQTWLDVYFGKFKWYRKMKKGTWHKHQFTKDAEELTFPQGNTWWARYGKINRYSNIIETEVY